MPLRQAELAKELGWSRDKMSRRVASYVKKGWIRKQPDYQNPVLSRITGQILYYKECRSRGIYELNPIFFPNAVGGARHSEGQVAGMAESKPADSGTVEQAAPAKTAEPDEEFESLFWDLIDDRSDLAEEEATQSVRPSSPGEASCSDSANSATDATPQPVPSGDDGKASCTESEQSVRPSSPGGASCTEMADSADGGKNTTLQPVPSGDDGKASCTRLFDRGRHNAPQYVYPGIGSEVRFRKARRRLPVSNDGIENWNWTKITDKMLGDFGLRNFNDPEFNVQLTDHQAKFYIPGYGDSFEEAKKYQVEKGQEVFKLVASLLKMNEGELVFESGGVYSPQAHSTLVIRGKRSGRKHCDVNNTPDDDNLEGDEEILELVAKAAEQIPTLKTEISEMQNELKSKITEVVMEVMKEEIPIIAKSIGEAIKGAFTVNREQSQEEPKSEPYKPYAGGMFS